MKPLVKFSLSLCALLLSSGFHSGRAANLVGLEGNSLLVLHPNRAKALTAENSGKILIPEGTLQVFSQSRSAISLRNAAEVTVDTVALAGGVQMDNGATANSRQNSRLKEGLDPLAQREAVKKDGLTWHGAFDLNEGETQLEPGLYDGIFLSGNAKIFLAPGVYIIEHELVMSGQSQMVGDGVTLINEGEMRLDNSSTLKLAAPQDGPMKEIVLWQPRENNRLIQFSGSATAVLHGVLYLPSGTLNLQSSAKLQCTNLVSEAVKVTNSAELLVK